MKKSIVVLLHVAYWAIYWLLVAFVILATFQGRKHLPGGFFFLSPIPVAMILSGAIGFYGSNLYLFRKFLEPKKMWLLVLSALLLSAFASLVTELVLYLAFPNYGINWSAGTCMSLGLCLAFIALVHSVTGLVMKGFVRWFGDLRLKEELARKNYEMELALMRSQVNPHFLFNTINNIDSLISKDPVAASAYLNRLSDIMRFMLYESGAEKIPLAKELEYIEKFIALQKIRTSNQSYVQYAVSGVTAGVMIPPMLLIAFVENAFKHSDNKKVENAITIRVTISQQHIRFTCSNAFSVNHRTAEAGGLGTRLIKRRLELLYPGRHKLVTGSNDDIYKVELDLRTDQ